KFIESGMAKVRLAVRSRAPPTSVGPRPRDVAAPPQRTPPSATPPCDAIMCTAFIRPRLQSGVARWPAVPSSEADTVQLMPAKAVIGKNAQRFGTMDIRTITTTRTRLSGLWRAGESSGWLLAFLYDETIVKRCGESQSCESFAIFVGI